MDHVGSVAPMRIQLLKRSVSALQKEQTRGGDGPRESKEGLDSIGKPLVRPVRLEEV